MISILSHQDKLGYLSELEKVKNFNWDEWRKRFLKHNNNKKSRVTDLFRKLDEDADGFLTRDDFIDGILKNKFPSSKLEMNAVAGNFDNFVTMLYAVSTTVHQKNISLFVRPLRRLLKHSVFR